MTRGAFHRRDLRWNLRRPRERPLHLQESAERFRHRPHELDAAPPSASARASAPGHGSHWASRFSRPRRRRSISAADTRRGHVRAVFVPRTRGLSPTTPASQAVADLRCCERRAGPFGSAPAELTESRSQSPFRGSGRAPARRVSNTRCHRRARTRPGEDRAAAASTGGLPANRRPREGAPNADEPGCFPPSSPSPA